MIPVDNELATLIDENYPEDKKEFMEFDVAMFTAKFKDSGIAPVFLESENLAFLLNFLYYTCR